MSSWLDSFSHPRENGDETENIFLENDPFNFSDDEETNESAFLGEEFSLNAEYGDNVGSRGGASFSREKGDGSVFSGFFSTPKNERQDSNATYDTPAPAPQQDTQKDVADTENTQDGAPIESLPSAETSTADTESVTGWGDLFPQPNIETGRSTSNAPPSEPYEEAGRTQDANGLHPLDAELLAVTPEPEPVKAPSSLADFQKLLDAQFQLPTHVETLIENEKGAQEMDASLLDGIAANDTLPSERKASEIAHNVSDTARNGFLPEEPTVVPEWELGLFQRGLAPTNDERRNDKDLQVMGKDEEDEFYSRRAQEIMLSTLPAHEPGSFVVKEIDINPQKQPFVMRDGKLFIDRKAMRRTQPIVTEEVIDSDKQGRSVLKSVSTATTPQANKGSKKLTRAQLQTMMEVTKTAGQLYIETDNTRELKRNRAVTPERARRKVGEFLWSQSMVDNGQLGNIPFFGSKDMNVLDFLCRFKFASVPSISIILGKSRKKTVERLKQLEDFGLVKEVKNSAAPVPIWRPTESAMIACGLSLKVLSDRSIKVSTLHHQMGVNHVAACLIAGVGNPLNLPDFPQRNRMGIRKRRMFGEQVVSEYQIRSSFGQYRGFGMGGSQYNPIVIKKANEEWSRWMSSNDNTNSPEMRLGNEWMWTIVPQDASNLQQHYPDLVLKRPRLESGVATSVAVEVELSAKNEASYSDVLRAYMSDNRIYSKVVYVCGDNLIANMIERAGLRTGLIQTGKLDIVPVISRSNEIVESSQIWTL